MQLIKHAAAGVLLAGCACAASATTVCPYGQDEYYGKNVVQEIVARISAERRKTANEIIARNQNSNFVCWVEPRSPEDQAYCDLVFSDHNPFPSGHFPVDLTVGLELGTSENIANDWGNSTKYKTRSVREIWEIESWNPLNASGKYIRKLATTYSSNYEPFAECVNHDSAVAFLNGVFTTSRAANNSLDALRATLRAKRNDTPAIPSALQPDAVQARHEDRLHGRLGRDIRSKARAAGQQAEGSVGNFLGPRGGTAQGPRIGYGPYPFTARSSRQRFTRRHQCCPHEQNPGEQHGSFQDAGAYRRYARALEYLASSGAEEGFRRRGRALARQYFCVSAGQGQSVASERPRERHSCIALFRACSAAIDGPFWALSTGRHRRSDQRAGPAGHRQYPAIQHFPSIVMG